MVRQQVKGGKPLTSALLLIMYVVCLQQQKACHILGLTFASYA